MCSIQLFLPLRYLFEWITSNNMLLIIRQTLIMLQNDQSFGTVFTVKERLSALLKYVTKRIYFYLDDILSKG